MNRHLSVRIVENCFLESQIKQCRFDTYFNHLPDFPDERYLFFESEVIAKLVMKRSHTTSDFFGVLGPRWQEKLRDSMAQSRELPIRTLSKDTLDSEDLDELVHQNSNADFISLGRFIPHRVFALGDRLHPGLMETTDKLLQAIGVRFNIKQTIPKPIYFNYFIAKSSALNSYVYELLEPVIQAATSDPLLRALCFQNSGYFRKLRPEISSLYGIDYYPLHPFIGERLINIYTVLSGCKVVCFNRSGHRNNVREIGDSLELNLKSFGWNWLTRRGWKRQY